MLAFVVFISGTIALIVLAGSRRSDLVSADYYDQEMRYQEQLDRLRRTTDLGAEAAVAYDPAERRINISVPATHVGRIVNGTIQLYRPSSAALDSRLPLTPDDRGRQTLDARELQPGLWSIRVSWTVDGREYFLDQAVVVGGDGRTAAGG